MNLPHRLAHFGMRCRAPISTLVTVLVALLLTLTAPLASAETRGYVVSWFATATNNPDFVQNCPQEAKDPDRVKFVFGVGLTSEGGRGRYHALVNGKPVAPLNYPDAVKENFDWEPVVGQYAYGFDLGGPETSKFTDPETHQRIDNQLWRALGCNYIFQATPPRAPYFQEEGWMNFIDSSPGWAIQITGADLSKDGPVTVTLDRTIRHPERDALGGIRSDVTYVINSAARSHNVLSGEIKDGVLTISPGYIYLEGDMTWYSEIDLKDAHIRMHSEPGKLVGYWGGYTDWHRWAYQCTSRPASECDGVGFYRALKQFADADPDPVTGQNRMISTTWRMEAVPAFLATKEGRILATASSAGLGNVVHAPSVAEDPNAR